MSDQTHPQQGQPWLSDVPASQPAAAPNAQLHAPADLGRLAQQPAPKPSRGYWSHVLPESVTEAMSWGGNDADRVFGIWEPTAGEIRKLTKAGADYSDAASNFVCALGVMDPATNAYAIGEDGLPVLRPVDNTRDVAPWWARLTPKAQAMIIGIFMGMTMPTEDEGKSLRASKKWRG